MRVLLFLAISGLLLSQPQSTVKTDSVSPTKVEVPEAVKPTVEKIVEEAKQTKKLEEATSKEMQKQLDLMKEIKIEILKLKKSAKVKKAPSNKVSDTSTVENKATKEEEVLMEVEGQIVQWETRKRTWLGRILNAKDILYYPYIIDKDGKKVYLK